MKLLFVVLQAELPNASRGIEMLFQYGVLGLFSVILIYALWYMEKERKKEREATWLSMSSKITVLETKMDLQQKDYRIFVETSYKKSVEVNERCIIVMEEVKEILIQHKF